MAFYGKVALITGGASGIGKVHALQLAGQGAEFVILDIDDSGLAECSAIAANITPLKCDVRDLLDVAKAVARVPIF